MPPSGLDLSSSPRAMNRVVLWFRNDLRLHDNAVVDRARRSLAKGECKEVLPLYCFDPRNFSKSEWGSPKTGPHRAKFILESVRDLRQRLRDIGSDLLVAVDRPENVLPKLVSPGTLVLASSEVASEELAVERRVRSAVQQVSGDLDLLWTSTLFHPGDLPLQQDMRDMPDVFTPFRNLVERKCRVRSACPTPVRGSLPLGESLLSSPLVRQMCAFEPSFQDLPLAGADVTEPVVDGRAALNFQGGETAALDRLRYYLWSSDKVATYFNTRNGMLGGDYSTKFSPWLAIGCLSPRQIYHEIRKYEAAKVENKSTYWVIFELIWRDFFRFFCAKHGNKVFLPGGTVGRAPQWSQDADAVRRWRQGETGVPLVDANMREMAHTGFMSNRGRQNVASYLALDLKLDWRLGADHFESCLLDYDVCSNWGNWVSAAGLTGGRVNKFNIVKQSKDYDRDGSYVRTWVPELRDVPTQYVHTPWLMPMAAQRASGCIVGEHYPEPLSKAGVWEPYANGSVPRREGGAKKPYRGYYEKGRKGGGKGGRQGQKRRSEFEMYG